MPRRDKHHFIVKTALQKDGWTITDDPLTVPTVDMDFFIDLGAKRAIIGAKKDNEEIAVEIKSLIGGSVYYDYYRGLGQFLIYRMAMDKRLMMNRMLFLAVPKIAFDELLRIEIFRESWTHFSVNLLVFDEDDKIILQWLRH